MDLLSYWRRLVRRWPIFVSVFLVVAAGLTGASFLIPPSYDASVRVVITPNLAADTPMGTRQIADLYLTSRMKTYAELVPTNEVLQPVIDSLGLGMGVSDLAEEIEVTIPAGTTIIEMSVPASTGEKAASTANRIANQMPWAVANLESAATIAESPVQVRMLQPADVPGSPSSPKILLNLIVAIGLAFVAGVSAALIVDNFRSRARRTEPG